MKLILLLIAEALLTLDWRQTLTIARNPRTESEINRILGPHPSVVAVCRYFLICMVGIALFFLLSLLAILAPFSAYLSAASIAVSLFVIALEATVTIRNRKLFGAWWL